jgi:hypothetical protein
MRRLVVCLLVSACATAPAPTPTSSTAPTAQPHDTDLEVAWQSEAPPAGAGPVISVVDSPAAVDHRGPFRDALASAQAELAGKRFDDAREAVQLAHTTGATLPPDEREAAWPLALKVEQAAGDVARARAVALAWRSACLSAPCRTRALTALGKLAGFAPLAKKLFDAEACVTQGEKTGSVPPCLNRSVDPTSDEVFAARMASVRAVGEKAAGRRVAALEHVVGSCTKATGCVAVQRAALAKLAAQALADEDLEGAVKAWVREGQAQASQVAPELRLWVRPSELDAVCVKYDAKAGAGACRKLEKQLGDWSFRDFSTTKVGQGLKPDVVRQVSDHYAPLLQECLTEQALRLGTPDAQRFEVRWTVHNDGRVRDAHLRRDLDDSPLGKCLRGQFAWWRYPRFEGEFQNVEQSFTVTATTRRIPQ